MREYDRSGGAHTHTHTRRTECMHEGAVVGRWGVCGRERLEGVSAKLILVFFFYVSPLKSARATRTRARARNTHSCPRAQHASSTLKA